MKNDAFNKRQEKKTKTNIISAHITDTDLKILDIFYVIFNDDAKIV